MQSVTNFFYERTTKNNFGLSVASRWKEQTHGSVGEQNSEWESIKMNREEWNGDEELWEEFINILCDL